MRPCPQVPVQGHHRPWRPFALCLPAACSPFPDSPVGTVPSGTLGFAFTPLFFKFSLIMLIRKRCVLVCPICTSFNGPHLLVSSSQGRTNSLLFFFLSFSPFPIFLFLTLILLLRASDSNTAIVEERHFERCFYCRRSSPILLRGVAEGAMHVQDDLIREGRNRARHKAPGTNCRGANGPEPLHTHAYVP